MRIIIVGCGIIGLATAYSLRDKGYDITIVCHDIPGVSSKANAGIVTASFTPSPWPGFITLLKALIGSAGPLAIGLREVLSLEGLNWALKAYRAKGGRIDILKSMAYRSLALYENLLRRLGDISYRRGVLALFSKASDAELHSKLHGGRILRADEVKSLGFEGFEAGVLAEDEIALDPVMLVDSLRRELSEHTFLDDMVTSIKRLGNEVKVLLERGDSIKSDHVIIASGAWTPGIVRNLGVRIPVKPARGLTTLLKTVCP